jgi:hypothetical protein
MAKRNVGKDLIGELESRIDADDLLSLEERAEIKAQAREEVAKRRKDKAIKTLLDREIRLAEVEHDPDEQLVDILIDLPAFSAYVRLDNVVYFHGILYEVRPVVAATMRDVMARAWEHQNEIDGRKRIGDLTRRMADQRISPSQPNGAKLTTVASMVGLR